jgi:hypothetical protein
VIPEFIAERLAYEHGSLVDFTGKRLDLQQKADENWRRLTIWVGGIEPAGFDEGLPSLCRPRSRLCGKSLWMRRTSVTNDSMPSYLHRPRRRRRR